ncbi:MAG: threonine synthase [Oscillospiraceae bacterium]|nr:threonine synthase [Oscillospiraceae bacterium]
MLYQSTRGKGGKISFEEAIIKGIADDGGLYVPVRVPKVGPEFIASLAGMDYVGTAVEIMKLYTANFSERELRECASRAYNGQSFTSPDITPLRELDRRVSVLELFHGPTSAFKDVALQLLPKMLTMAMQKQGVDESVAILVATSGDTGKAALEGYKDVPGTSILVFYPKDGVSEAQKLQMVTQEGGNVAVAAVEGNFDDAQTGVKAIFADADANARLREKGRLLSSANSINWGRLMPQIVYYFRAYATLLKRGRIQNGERVRFVVPTGNFGNILAGWYASEMGLPVSRFICASNSNNVLSDFIRTGVYNKNRDFFVTMSPAMDILISSNLERLLYEMSGRDAGSVARWMGELARTGRYDVGEAMRQRLSRLFYGGHASEEETAQAVGDAYRRYDYILDTHTAVGMHVLREYDNASMATGDAAADSAGSGAGAGVSAGCASCVGRADGDEATGNTAANDAYNEKVIVVATASPYKFAKDVYNAIACGKDSGADAPDELSYIDLLASLSGEPAPAPLRNLRDKAVLHTTSTTKGDMKQTALDLLTALADQKRQEDHLK